MKNASPILVENKINCFGCAACQAVCPVHAINMVCDEYGFEYPVIDEKLCIGCNKCKNVCAYTGGDYKSSPKQSFAAVSTNTDVLNSASGGVFASLASEFINQGGTVIGCAIENINQKIIPHHIAVEHLGDLQKLMGSKYVHSNTAEIFEKAKILLNDKKRVLFSGTPCQVAALYAYLGKKYDNLFTIDLICHGVPSRKMFWDYLDLLSDKYGTVKDFVFRDKRRGLTFVARALCNKNGKEYNKYIQYGESSYYSYFLQGNTYRDCCYTCKYACKERVGDITIGDFWGIKEQHPELFDGHHKEFDAEKGISCLIQNTENGKRLVETYGKGLSLHPTTFDKIAKENKQLLQPSIAKGNHDEIMRIYKTDGYQALDDYFLKQAGSSVMISKLKAKVPLWMKKMIKN